MKYDGLRPTQAEPLDPKATGAKNGLEPLYPQPARTRGHLLAPMVREALALMTGRSRRPGLFSWSLRVYVLGPVDEDESDARD
jgi:hypothetical protein